MNLIPYKISGQISSVFPFPQAFYSGVWDVLIGIDGLGLELQFYYADSRAKNPDVLLPNAQAAYCVLRHVAHRTLQFNKLFEFVRVSDIVEGMPTIGIAGAPFKERAIKDALKYLVDSCLLIKICLPKNNCVTPLYGLNLYILLMLLEPSWKEAILSISDDDPEYEWAGKAKSAKSLRAQKTLSFLNNYLKEFKKLIYYFYETEEKEGTIKNIDSFCNELRKLLPSKETCYSHSTNLTEWMRNYRIIKRKPLVYDE